MSNYHVVTAPKKTIEKICRKYSAEYITETFAVFHNIPEDIKNVSSLHLSSITEDEYRAIIETEKRMSLKQGMPVVCISEKYKNMIGILREITDTCLVELSTMGSMITVKVPICEILPLEVKNFNS